MFTKNSFNFKTLLLISLLALSLPLATNLVQRSSDDRSRATETDKSKINLKIAFKGVKPESTCSASLKTVDLDIVNITKKVYQPGVGTSITPVVGETNPDGDQVFSISNLVLDNNFKSTDSFNYIQIKNPAYLSARMCFNNQSSKMTTSSACDLPLTNGATYDFTKYSLLPGDLNQDGIVNSSDFSTVKYNLDSTADPVCGQETDLNYDGVTNSFDLTYLKKSLLQTNDEVVIDPTTITPTPTASPQKRSLKAYQMDIGEGWSNMAYDTGSTKVVYWLYTPNGYTKDKKWPLVVYLYGSDSMDTNKPSSGLGGWLQQGHDYDAVILIPQEVWSGNKIQLRFFREKMIPYITEEYNIDTDKISISGHSSAAGHIIFMSVWYPNSFSAIVPISLCRKDPTWVEILKKDKFWIFHGTGDTVCSPSSGSTLAWWIDSKKAGGYGRFTEVKADHGATPFKAFKDYDPVSWMIKQTRGQPVVY